nr:damaged DNA binding 2 [Tanacetum cinerariifolium]
MSGVSLRVKFEGCFMHAPLRYQDGKKLILAIRRMAYEEFFELLKNTVGFAHSLYYKVPNVKLETGLVRVERATQDEAVQGEDNQRQQQDNPVEHDNPETAIYVE